MAGRAELLPREPWDRYDWRDPDLKRAWEESHSTLVRWQKALLWVKDEPDEILGSVSFCFCL